MWRGVDRSAELRDLVERLFEEVVVVQVPRLRSRGSEFRESSLHPSSLLFFFFVDLRTLGE